MAEEPDAIKHHIDRQREVLGENLHHLEHRVRAATNWRTWVERKPLAAAGFAFAAGLLVALRRGR